MIIKNLDGDPERQDRIRRTGVVEALMRYDWVYRWEAVLKTIGLEPMQAALERKERLRKLAEVVLQTDGAPTDQSRDSHVFSMTTAGHCWRRYFVGVRMDRLTRADAKVGLLNHIGGGNLGDDATFDAIADNIKWRWPRVEIVAFSMNPDDTETRHGITSYPIRRRRWSIGYKRAETKTTLKETVKALTRNTAPSFTCLRQQVRLFTYRVRYFGSCRFWRRRDVI